MPISAETLAKYRATRPAVLVETGSGSGEGIRRALQAGFREVRSVELSDHWYRHCVHEFWNNPEVTLYHGLSEEFLEVMLKPFVVPVTIFLDGHYAGDGTSHGPKSCPLMEELAIIGRHSVKTHTLIVDDLRVWRRDDPTIGFGVDEIIEAVKRINPDYVIGYEDGEVERDILTARVKE
jgi:hypothetical protein